MSEHSNFRVLIVGGGIGGLTLANSLQHAGVDYLVLESHAEVHPQVGASIAIFGNGGRILDQMGIYEDICKHTEPTVTSAAWQDGNLRARRDGPMLMTARTGYPIAFLDRQLVLEALYDHLWDKTKVRVGKKVEKIEHTAKGITLYCKDGSMFDGDLVAGADGVHSMVRTEMWRNADAVEPGKITQDEKNIMLSEYTCMYGISQGVENLPPGELSLTFGKDISFLVVAGKNGRIFWFVFKKMDKKYEVPNIPRFSDEDAMKQASDLLQNKITDTVRFENIWEKRTSYTLVALEEALFKTWSWGRFACLGDSVHKMTPNIGQGGNAAIESAAALSNSLKRLLSNNGSSQPSMEGIQAAMEAYHAKRADRIKAILTAANKQTRIDSFRGPIERLIVLKIMPYLGHDFVVNLQSQNMIGAERLEYLPVPERSLNRGMPFNQSQGVTRHENVLQRALIAVPLLTCGRIYQFLISQNGGIDTTNSAPFLLTLAPIYLIWLIESHRRANQLTTIRFPLLLAATSYLFSLSTTTNLALYFFLHYIQSPIAQYRASDLRLVQVNYARTALPSILLGFLLQVMAFHYSSSSSLQQLIFQPLPACLIVYVIHRTLSSFVTDTTMNDRIHNPTADLSSLRLACQVIGVITALSVLYTRLTHPVSFSISTYSPILLSSYTWLALLYKDLKIAGMVDVGVFKLWALVLGSTLLAGPGATVLAGWMWRENILATRRHKGAVMRN